MSPDRATAPAGVSALYLHVPFCVRKCAYCDFPSWPCPSRSPLPSAYERALASLVDEVAEAGLLSRGGTCYVGGGTPSLLGADGLGDLVGHVARAMAPRELSVEANPESVSEELLDRVRDAGATRVSLGIQSLDDAELSALGRIHDAVTARSALALACASGLRTSCDLMCGIPLQTRRSWLASLRGVLELGVGHVSCYPLMVEEGTRLWDECEAGRMDWPDDDEQASLMVEAEDVLTTCGLARYEVASYARAGEECAHNVAYWTGVSYLGLGTQAAGMLRRDEYEALRAVAPALPAPPAGMARLRTRVTSSASDVSRATRLADLTWEVEALTEAQAAAEDLMLAARMSQGISSELVERASQVLGTERVGECLGRLVGEGLLRHGADGSLAPTERGWLMGNEVFGPLWDLADPHTMVLGSGEGDA